MKAQNLLLSALALAAALGCDKPENGVGPTEPSRRYEGVEEPPKWQPEQSPGTVPTQGAPQGTTGNAEQPLNAQANNVDQPGQTTTPVTAFADGATPASPSAGTQPSGERQSAGGPGDKLDPEAKAVFKAAPGVKLKGEAELEVAQGGVKIEVEVEKAPPGAKGIHIHQKPDCTDIPGKSMGDHFAPDVKEHGMPGSGPHHLGDLGNITIGEDGEGELEITVAKANLKEGDPMSLLGRAIVIHEKNDEGGKAQPSGNSGKPIACAVIKPE